MPKSDEKYVCTLSPEIQKIAKDELNEDPERRAADIQYIRDWLKKQPHINARTDDFTILRFLRGCKFSLERTKEKLDMFYTCKTAIPEWYSNRDPALPEMKAILDLGMFLPLPGYDAKGQKVILFRFAGWDPRKFSIDDICRCSYFVLDVAIQDEQTCITGMAIVEDMRGLSMSHMTTFTPALAKKSLTLFQEGYPTRPKGINYINTPAAFDSVFSIFKSFMKEKMKKRVHIHGSNMESLHKQVPKEILPVEYGGTNGTIEEIKNEWMQKVLEKREWLIEDEKFRVDESKRPGKPKTSADLFGLEGSFRKLNVD